MSRFKIRRGKFYSCNFIEYGLYIGIRRLQFCCENVPGNKNNPPIICDYEGGELPVDKILSVKDEVRTLNQRVERHPGCKGCGNLKKKYWQSRKFLFDVVVIGHSNRCNLMCSYCYRNVKKMDQPEQIFSIYPLIKSMCEKGYLSPDAKIGWGGGEPTFLKEFEAVTGLLFNHKVFQIINTNATIFSNVLEKVLEKGLVMLICSVDAGTAKTYQKMKKYDFFDKVLDNLAKYIKTGGQVYAKYIIVEDNYHEVGEFVKKAKQIGVKNVIYAFNHYNIHPDDNIISAAAEMIHECSQYGIGIESYGSLSLRSEAFRRKLEKAIIEKKIALKQAKFLHRYMLLLKRRAARIPWMRKLVKLLRFLLQRKRYEAQ